MYSRGLVAVDKIVESQCGGISSREGGGSSGGDGMNKSSLPPPTNFLPPLLPDSDNVFNSEEIRDERIRKGYCGTCHVNSNPTKCFDIKKRFPGFIRKRIPLTVQGEVLCGVCLICHPEMDPNNPNSSTAETQSSSSTIEQRSIASHQIHEPDVSEYFEDKNPEMPAYMVKIPEEDKSDRKKSSSSSSSEKKSSSSSSSERRRSSKKSSESGAAISSNGTSSSEQRSSSASAAAAATSSASAAASSASVNKQGPGPVSIGSDTATFRVQVPPNVKPGEEFQVYAGSKIVKVRCPKNVRPGQSLHISVPVDPLDRANSNGSSAGGGPPSREGSGSNGGGSDGMNKSSSLPPLENNNTNNNNNYLPPFLPDSDNVTKIPNQTLAPGEMPAYMVKIPEGVRGGTQFPVTINGQQLMVTCPNMARHPMSVRIVPPPPPKHARNIDGRQNNQQQQQQLVQYPNSNGGGGQYPPQRQRMPNRVLNPNKQSSDKTKMFEVVVPTGVRPGQPFALLAGGVRVLVTCPKNAVPGKTIRFHLPIGLVNANKDGGPKSKLAEIKLSYDKDGWTRTIRATDM